MRSVSSLRSALVVGLLGAIALGGPGCARVHIEPESGTGGLGGGAGGVGGRGGGAGGRGGSGGDTGGSIGGLGGAVAGGGGSGGSGGAGGSAGAGGRGGGGAGGTAGTAGSAGSAGTGGSAGRGGAGGSAGTGGNGGAGGSGGRGGSGGTGGVGGTSGVAGTGGSGTGGSPDGGTPVTPTVAGQIVITELMHATSVVSDSVGEWAEVYNPSDTVTYNLKGCAIHDLSNFFVFPSDIVVPPHAFRALAIFSSGGGFIPDATYSGVRFDNSFSDQCEILCLGTNGTLIDQFVYTDPEAMTTARSFIVDPRHYNAVDNDLPANHCIIDAIPANVYNMNAGGTVFDYGTPGKTNPECPNAN